MYVGPLLLALESKFWTFESVSPGSLGKCAVFVAPSDVLEHNEATAHNTTAKRKNLAFITSSWSSVLMAVKRSDTFCSGMSRRYLPFCTFAKVHHTSD